MAPGSRKFREFPSCRKSGGQAGPAPGAGWPLSELDPVQPAVQSAARSCSALARDTRLFPVSKLPRNKTCVIFVLPLGKGAHEARGGRESDRTLRTLTQLAWLNTGSLIGWKDYHPKYLSQMPSVWEVTEDSSKE